MVACLVRGGCPAGFTIWIGWQTGTISLPMSLSLALALAFSLTLSLSLSMSVSVCLSVSVSVSLWLVFIDRQMRQFILWFNNEPDNPPGFCDCRRIVLFMESVCNYSYQILFKGFGIRPVSGPTVWIHWCADIIPVLVIRVHSLHSTPCGSVGGPDVGMRGPFNGNDNRWGTSGDTIVPT